MERKPEHLQEDPLLRAEYISQISCDEHFLEHAPFLLHPNAKQLVEEGLSKNGMRNHGVIFEDVLHVATENWKATLDPKTNLNEQLYLMGFTDIGLRKQQIDQLHAAFLRRAVEVGLVDERPQDREFKRIFGE